MNLSCLLSLLKEMPSYRQLVDELSIVKGDRKASILDTAKPYLIAALYEELDLPIMVVTGQPESARKLYEQLRAWCSPSAELHRLPELDFLPYDSEPGVPLRPSCIVSLSSTSCLMIVLSYRLSAIRRWRG